jgi:Mn-dependent DtxR family transcriptional regulator
MDTDELIDKKLDTIIDLLRHLVALQLSKAGVSRDVIGKRLHVAKSTVVEMLKGIKSE